MTIPRGLGAHHVRILRLLEVEGREGARVAVHTNERTIDSDATVQAAHVGFLQRRKLIEVAYGVRGRRAFITDAGRALLTELEDTESTS